MPKRAKNLLLEADALNRGEEYCKRHETTLSRLVNDFLLALPETQEGERAKSPIVEQLRGAVINPAFTGSRYSDYLNHEAARLQKRFEDDAYLER